MKGENCLDANLGQIVCDKDGVVDWMVHPIGGLELILIYQRSYGVSRTRCKLSWIDLPFTA